jgi:hypothetical protein
MIILPIEQAGSLPALFIYYGMAGGFFTSALKKNEKWLAR